MTNFNNKITTANCDCFVRLICIDYDNSLPEGHCRPGTGCELRGKRVGCLILGAAARISTTLCGSRIFCLHPQLGPLQKHFLLQRDVAGTVTRVRVSQTMDNFNGLFWMLVDKMPRTGAIRHEKESKFCDFDKLNVCTCAPPARNHIQMRRERRRCWYCLLTGVILRTRFHSVHRWQGIRRWFGSREKQEKRRQDSKIQFPFLYKIEYFGSSIFMINFIYSLQNK